jgi:tetratricopeptide (TPR) repeat protein
MAERDTACHAMHPEEHQSDEAASLAFEQGVTDFVKAVNEKSDAEAASIGWQMLLRAGTEALSNPSPSVFWMTKAAECEDVGNWAAAEDARKKALEAGMEHVNPAYAVKPHLDLASLYTILGRSEEALKHVEAALEVARKSELTPLLLLALEARLKCDCDNDTLREIRSTAMDRLGTLDEGRIFHHTKARLLLVEAECSLMLGETDLAWEHLTKAQAFTVDWGENEFMAGHQACRARAAKVRASLHAARAEWEQAILAHSEAVAREKSINSQDHVRGLRSRHQFAKTLAGFADYLERGGRVNEAAQVREESRRLFDELKIVGS